MEMRGREPATGRQAHRAKVGEVALTARPTENAAAEEGVVVKDLVPRVAGLPRLDGPSDAHGARARPSGPVATEPSGPQVAPMPFPPVPKEGGHETIARPHASARLRPP